MERFLKESKGFELHIHALRIVYRFIFFLLTTALPEKLTGVSVYLARNLDTNLYARMTSFSSQEVFYWR